MFFFYQDNIRGIVFEARKFLQKLQEQGLVEKPTVDYWYAPQGLNRGSIPSILDLRG